MLSIIVLLFCTSLSVFTLSKDTGQRFYMSLNGLWQFKVDYENKGINEKWFHKIFENEEHIDMPVPSSFNDVTVNRDIRDHVGWVWYQRHFSVPSDWVKNKRIVIKFGAAHYYTYCWINDKYVGFHEGGHIPFEFEITESLSPDTEIYKITVAINNTLNEFTIPQGFVNYENNTSRYPPGYRTYSHNFDYFDYAGLNGNVNYYVTSFKYIEDINIVTKTSNQVYTVNYVAALNPKNETNLSCLVSLVENKNTINTSDKCIGSIEVQNPKIWWPVSSKNRTVGSTYILKVELKDQFNQTIDIKEEKFGFREISWNEKNILLNGENVYLKGFGMHQDSEIRGRGFDYVQLTKDINLLNWINANAVRTSHYPYFEEFLELTDKYGIMVIVEAPACTLSSFPKPLLSQHKFALGEMWKIFKNHPSVIAWSLANEPYSNLPEAEEYFKTLKDYMKILDPTRPITFVSSQQTTNEKAVQHMDFVCVNRYSGWYQDGGKLELISYQVTAELLEWIEKYNKPILMTEYGAGSLSGLHELPSQMWSEEFQKELLEEHFKAFDYLRSKGNLLGELIWNFADFNTPQEYFRPGKCAKGVFTRNRQPKAAAYSVKNRFSDSKVSINK